MYFFTSFRQWHLTGLRKEIFPSPFFKPTKALRIHVISLHSWLKLDFILRMDNSHSNANIIMKRYDSLRAIYSQDVKGPGFITVTHTEEGSGAARSLQSCLCRELQGCCISVGCPRSQPRPGSLVKKPMWVFNWILDYSRWRNSAANTRFCLARKEKENPRRWTPLFFYDFWSANAITWSKKANEIN